MVHRIQCLGLAGSPPSSPGYARVPILVPLFTLGTEYGQQTTRTTRMSHRSLPLHRHVDIHRFRDGSHKVIPVLPVSQEIKETIPTEYMDIQTDRHFGRTRNREINTYKDKRPIRTDSKVIEITYI